MGMHKHIAREQATLVLVYNGVSSALQAVHIPNACIIANMCCMAMRSQVLLRRAVQRHRCSDML
jgi:hypothetical protein